MCGGLMKEVLVQKGRRIPHKNAWTRKIIRLECDDKKCGHTETPFNSEREQEVSEGFYD